MIQLAHIWECNWNWDLPEGPESTMACLNVKLGRAGLGFVMGKDFRTHI